MCATTTPTNNSLCRLPGLRLRQTVSSRFLDPLASCLSQQTHGQQIEARRSIECLASLPSDRQPPLPVARGSKVSPPSGPTFSCCDSGSFHERNAHLLPTAHSARSSHGRQQKALAANRGSRFTDHMRKADSAVSKLFAEVPRHTQVRRISSACLRSTWQGGNPRCIPLCRKRHVETLPVSTPSGLCGDVAPSSFGEVRR